MDSYNFHFERMSNLDLHPLSLPVSRLSPAKSSSSIVDQLTHHHHQHGKGDSAYSSFSGGSTAPDYPSPFLQDDLQSSSLHHYADMKYVKAIYHPSQVLQSDAKSMDQLYQAISQQYHHNNGHHINNENDVCHGNNKPCNQKMSAEAQSPSSPSPLPPPPPTRLDSFIATRNLENNHAHHLSNESQQQATLQHPTRSQSQGIARPLTANLNSSGSGLRSDLVYGDYRGPAKQPQPQQPPSYRSHFLPQSEIHKSRNPDDGAVCEQELKRARDFSKSTVQGTNQPEHQRHRQHASRTGGNGSNGNNGEAFSSHFEGQRKRAKSANECLGPVLKQSENLWNASQNLINSSIQHKGQFYFITGVCKSTESNVKNQAYSSGSEAGSESSTVVEKHSLVERQRVKGRSHSTMDNLFTPPQQRPQSSNAKITDERESFTPVAKGQVLTSAKLQDEENHNVSSHKPAPYSTRSSHSFDALEQIDLTQSREIGRHTTNHPIFYCGPEENCLPPATQSTKEEVSLSSGEQSNLHKKEEPLKKGKRQPLGDVASERINKETTPLLYHLTGASRVALKPKKDIDVGTKGKELVVNNSDPKGVAPGCIDRAPQGEIAMKERGEVISQNCNTLDDSFKKYYKEKLKDAQSKVLRETSFKRRDLQLSWPHRLKQKPDLRPTVIHSLTPSQDSESSTETLTPSVTSEGTQTGSVKEEVREKEMESEKENGRPVNVAQPQVARIGGRRRLTPEQKKMCYSEPEKLNQIGSGANHSTCRSLGSESENSFPCDSEVEEASQQGEQGLVAARRKIFETRGRALSASSLTKTNLKHLQHKALVEYMERKTGQKVAEPQQPGPQVPPTPSQRHSIGEKPIDWGPRPLSVVKTPKKKLHRPHSAGRILDSSTSSIRYAQFFSGQQGSSPRQSSCKEKNGPCEGKSASVESLLDPPEPPTFFRNRSTSTPHAFQAPGNDKDQVPLNAMETLSLQKNTDDESLARPASEGQQRVRIVAQRGKSMEELGALKLTRSSALSKSSEQLDRIRSRSYQPDPGTTPGPDREKRSVSFYGEGRRDLAWGKDRELKQESVKHEQENQERRSQEKEREAQGQVPSHTQIKTPFKQESAMMPGAEEDVKLLPAAGTRDPGRSTSPASVSSSRPRVHSEPLRSSQPATEEVSRSRHLSEVFNPPPPFSLETSEKEMKSILSSSSSTETKTSEQSCSPSRAMTSSPVAASEQEQSVDEPSDDPLPSDSTQEVSLSCGVTTDPSLWLPPPEQGGKEEVQVQPLSDDLHTEESTCPAPPVQSRESSAFPSSPASNSDTSQVVGEQRDAVIDRKSEDDQKMEETETPAGEREIGEMRQPSEEPRWEELVEDVVKVDQSLARVLYPLANRKTALMLMEQLLSEDTLLMEEHYKKKQEQRVVESSETMEDADVPPCPTGPDGQIQRPLDDELKADVTEKKLLLISRLEERLRVVEETQGSLRREIQENGVRGDAVEVLVRERCLPLELERYCLFIGDLERVVSLLLCLSARLARVQNALSTVDQHTDAEEKQSLDSRHRLLCKQREDAKDLKDNLDRRESVVSAFLSRQLSAEQLQGYRRFVQTKASLLIRHKDLEERQRLAEEQLEALRSSLPP